MPLKVSLKGIAEPSPRDSRALSKIGQGVSHRAGASNTDSGASQLEARAGHKEDRASDREVIAPHICHREQKAFTQFQHSSYF